MSPEEVSAYGSAGAFVVAVLALAVSGYATVIARRGARSTERQAEIAARAYRLQAAPKMALSLSAGHEADLDVFTWQVDIARVGGPDEVRWRFDYIALLDTDSSTESPRRASDSEDVWLDGLSIGSGQIYKDLIGLDPGETPRGFSMTFTLQVVEAPVSGKVPKDADVWTHQERLTWTARPSREDIWKAIEGN